MSQQFVILGSGRSGSHMLQSALNQHPDIDCLGEVLNPLFPTEFNPSWSEENPSKPFRGFICQSSDFHRQDARLAEVLSAPSLKRIVLGRRGYLERYLSYKTALARGKFGCEDTPDEPVKIQLIPSEMFMAALEHRHREAWAEGFGTCLRIDYEDLVEDTNGTIQRVLAFLGATPVPLAPASQKQTKGEIQKRLSNPEILDRPDFIKAEKRFLHFPPDPETGGGLFEEELRHAVRACTADLAVMWQSAFRDLDKANPPKADMSNWQEILVQPLPEPIPIIAPNGKPYTLRLLHWNQLILRYLAVVVLHKKIPTNYSATSTAGRVLPKGDNLLEHPGLPFHTVRETLNWRGDIEKCYEAIHIPTMLRRLKTRVTNPTPKEDAMLQWLDRIVVPTDALTQCGLQLGEPTEKFFANILLEEIDQEFVKRQIPFHRVVDDYFADGTSPEFIDAILAIRETLIRIKLRWNEEKTGFPESTDEV